MDSCAESVYDMSVASNAVIGAGGVLLLPPSTLVDEYIRRLSSSLDSRPFLNLPVGSSLRVMVGCLQRETAHAVWHRFWKDWSEGRAKDDHTFGIFMNMSFVCSDEEVTYENRLASLIPKLWADGLISKAADLDLWYGGDDGREDWINSNNQYWARNIDF